MQLITNEIKAALTKQGDTGNMGMDDIMVVAKFFGGPATWYLYDWDRDTAGKDGECDGFPNRNENDPPNRLWVFANLNDPDCAECGTVLLQELQGLKIPPFGLGVERDTSWTPQPLSEVIQTIKRGGHL